MKAETQQLVHASNEAWRILTSHELAAVIFSKPVESLAPKLSKALFNDIMSHHRQL